MINPFRSIARLFREYDATLNGWRFDDVKKHIDGRMQNAGVSFIAESRSLALAEENRASGRKPRICFVSNLPPEDTGIATCSLHSLQDCATPLDLFCPVVDVDWFLTNGARARARSGGHVAVYDKSVFMTIASQEDYEAIVIAIGNSVHCFYIHDLLKRIESIGAMSKVVLYVHDPVLLHMIQRGIGIANSQFYGSIRRIYDRTDGVDAADYRPDWDVWNQLIARQIYGIRHFASLGVKGFLFNSAAAMAMAEQDLAGLDVFRAQIFHPVFAVDGAKPVPAAGRKRPGMLSVGTFGVPNGSKCTGEIVEAVTLLRQRGERVRLLIAGYQANQFFAEHGEALSHPDTEVFDGPTDGQLHTAMTTVDIAVQLRRHSLGESSGVVPMLLNARVPTIVSALGAFREYGAAVRQLPVPATPASIAEAILATAADPPAADAMAAYVASHDPAAFQKRLLEIIGEWRLFERSRGR